MIYDGHTCLSISRGVDKFLNWGGGGLAQILATPTFSTDLHHDRLNTQLTALHIDESMNDLQCIISFLKGLNEIEKE